jgi:HSP20 family protein
MTLAQLNTRLPAFPSFWREFDALFRDFNFDAVAPVIRDLVPATDIVELEKSIELTVDLPGVQPDGVEVKLEGDVLTVTAERKHPSPEESSRFIRRERSGGRFARSFVLPDSVEGTTPTAQYKHGVLTITLPKKELAQPKTLKVTVDG